MALSYKVKYNVALCISIVAGIMVVAGAGEAQGSFGTPELVSSAAWKLGIWTPIFAVTAPAVLYYRARKNS